MNIQMNELHDINIHNNLLGSLFELSPHELGINKSKTFHFF